MKDGLNATTKAARDTLEQNHMYEREPANTTTLHSFLNKQGTSATASRGNLS